MKAASALLAIVAAVALYFYWQRPITYPAGLLIESEPQQIELGNGVDRSFMANSS